RKLIYIGIKNIGVPINSVISASDYKISASNYIITTTDYKITDTDYRIGRHLRKNYSGQKRFAPQVQVGPYLPFHGCWRDEYFQIMNFCGPCPVLFIISAIFRIFTAYYGLWALP
ncbi:hypothetical protein, partial [uncultured Parabacteroides sp.]